MAAAAAEVRRSRVVDLGVWSLNISTSVGIIMINKQLMGATGYGFNFGARSDGPPRSPP